jgi:hypothetical protein
MDFNSLFSKPGASPCDLLSKLEKMKELDSVRYASQDMDEIERVVRGKGYEQSLQKFHTVSTEEKMNCLKEMKRMNSERYESEDWEMIYEKEKFKEAKIPKEAQGVWNKWYNLIDSFDNKYTFVKNYDLLVNEIEKEGLERIMDALPKLRYKQCKKFGTERNESLKALREKRKLDLEEERLSEKKRKKEKKTAFLSKMMNLLKEFPLIGI